MPASTSRAAKLALPRPSERVRKFCANYLRHTKGRWAGQPFILEDWQFDDLIDPVFGDVDPRTGLRRVDEALWGISRKNSKSTTASGVAIYGTFADGYFDPKTGEWMPEYGAEVYSVAGSKPQARIVFGAARDMVLASPQLRSMCRVYKDAIEVTETGGVYRVLSADGRLAHGYNPSMAIIDELHVHPNSDLYDALKTGTGARRQPLILSITTAGFDQETIAYKLYAAGKARHSKSFHFKWYEAKKDADPENVKSWIRDANPASWITEKYLKSQLHAPGMHPSVFRRLHMNQWTSSRQLWIPQGEWDANKAKPKIKPGDPIFVAVDAAPKRDCVTLDMEFRMADGRVLPAKELQVGALIVSAEILQPPMPSKAGTGNGGLGGKNRRVPAVVNWVTAPVKAIAPQRLGPVVEIRTKRGRKLRTTPEHPYMIQRGQSVGRKSPRGGWLKAADIVVGDRAQVALGWYEPLNISPDLQSWTLGALVGDGCLTRQMEFVGQDPDIVARMREGIAPWDSTLVPHSEQFPHRYRLQAAKEPGRGRSRMLAWLQTEQMMGKPAWEKRVPHSVMTGDPSAWAGFLTGYLDTDGHVKERQPTVEWTSASEMLLRDCQELLARLGVQSSVRKATRETTDRYGRIHEQWRLRTSDTRVLSQLLWPACKRKRSRLDLWSEGSWRRMDRLAAWDTVVAVEWLPPEPTLAIEIEGTHTHITNGLLTHNSTAVVIDHFDDDRMHNIACRGWRADEDTGYLDFDAVEQFLRDLCEQYDVQRILVDPYIMFRSMVMLREEGLPIEEFPQSPTRMVPASQTLYDVVIERRMRHGGDQLMREQSDNATVKINSRGWMLSKLTATGKIDSITAASMVVYVAEQGSGDEIFSSAVGVG